MPAEQLELVFEPVQLRWAMAERGALLWHAVLRRNGQVSLCGRSDVLWPRQEWVWPAKRCRECAAHLSAMKHGEEP